MVDNVRLKDIFIGDPDGLSEARNKYFDTLFYNKNNKYKLLCLDSSKFIITGRKGTGKTILGKYYEKKQNEKGVLSKYIDKEEVLFNQLQAIGNGNIPQKERAVFAKYAILSQIAGVLFENQKKVVRKGNIIYKIRACSHLIKLRRLLKRECIDGFNLKEFSLSSSSTVSGEINKNSSKLGSKIEQDKNKKYEKAPYYQFIDNIQKIILELLKNNPVNIIIDDLDEYDEKVTNNSDFAKFLSKFIEVSYKLNIDISKVSRDSKIVLLFRSDLLKLIHSESTNLNKYTVKSIVCLNWLENPNFVTPFNDSLMDMILNKIRVSCQSFRALDNEKLFSRMFPEKIKGRETLRFLLNYSHGRPRDIVNMLNVIIERYGDSNSFTNEMFIETEAEYSRAFTNELKNELSLYYDSDYIHDCFHTLSLIHKNNFWLIEAKEVVEHSKSRVPQIDDPEKMLEILYKFGVIGNMKITSRDANNRPNDFKYSFGYREDGNDIVNFQEKFTVHFALRKELV
ncbi:P-loop ATPase, Sll1717 family [Lacrimispora sp.]|uniref:P-loop ATPase, Sll1717 family n=1 Tax=Lacrimispora sp. TaxID=2719234 RepID=UPI00289EECFC|nr:hypothetical protein [Lacrimispora sp.]